MSKTEADRPQTRILMISSRRSIRRAATRALVSVGWDVETASFDRAELEPKLNSPFNLCIVDADAEKEELLPGLELLSARNMDANILLLSRNLGDKTVLDHVLERGLNNVIAKHGGFSAAQDMLDETELITTCDKLLTRDLFGIEKYLPVRAVQIHELLISRSNQRGEALSELEGFLEKIDCYDGIRPTITAVADELLMNAIFSAPRDPKGHAKYDERHRGDVFPLEPKEAVTFRYACDGRNVLLSVRDQFGSLDREMVMKYLGRGLMGEQGEVEQKKGGAGLGLYMVVHSINQLVFNIHANHATEIIASFYVRSGVRAFRTSGLSLNLFLVR